MTGPYAERVHTKKPRDSVQECEAKRLGAVESGDHHDDAYRARRHAH